MENKQIDGFNAAMCKIAKFSGKSAKETSDEMLPLNKSLYIIMVLKIAQKLAIRDKEVYEAYELYQSMPTDENLMILRDSFDEEQERRIISSRDYLY